MQYRKIADEQGLATYALIFEEGDEAFAELQRFARESGVNGASLTGVGAASAAVVGWFDFERKAYKRNAIDEQVEVVSLLGDIATTEDGEPQVHAHVVLATEDARARGGHLLELQVRPTLEVIVTETPTHLRKRSLPGVPIATIRLDESG
jgi:predicted DNA-binding protein with PD1-like motif